MAIIKDTNYWKEYNAKRKAYIQQKNRERYNQGSGCINATDKNTTVLEKIQPINTTKTDTTFNTTDAIKNNTTSKKDTTETNLQLCSTCSSMNAEYQTNKTYCLNCSLKVESKQEIVQAGLVQKLQQELTDLKTKLKNNNSCSLNHYSFVQLFKEASEQVKKDYQEIYQQYPETPRLCIDCHNRERNYQIMLKLLDDYVKKTKYEKPQ